MTRKSYPLEQSDEHWRKELSPLSFHVLREHGTEPAFRNEYNYHKAAGEYVCAACGTPLFSSQSKYDSGSGWPSFFEPIEKENVGQGSDQRYGMHREEIHCAKCGGHIGHVFPDGPKPTGLRYCTNSAALRFKPREKE